MKKTLVTLVIAGLSMVNCVSPGFGPSGSIFTSTKMGVYGNQVGGSKMGEACTMTILGLIAVGDGSVEAAAQNGNIKKVNTIDLNGFSVLGLFANLCTVVKGD